MKKTKINLGEFNMSSNSNKAMAIKFAKSLFKDYMVGQEGGFIKNGDFMIEGRNVIVEVELPINVKFNGDTRHPGFEVAEMLEGCPTKPYSVDYDEFIRDHRDMEFVPFIASEGCQIDSKQRNMLKEKYEISREGFLINHFTNRVNCPYFHKGDQHMHNTFLITKTDANDWGVNVKKCDTRTTTLVAASF